MNTILRKINLGFVGKVTNFRGDYVLLLTMLDTDFVRETEEVDILRTHHKIIFNNDVYFIFNEGNVTTVYKQLPIVKNDDNFNWTEIITRNGRNMRCTYYDGYYLKFCCMAYTETGVGRISVYYNKRVIDYINHLESADNEVFLKAIKEWKEDFKRQVS